jgi:prevent-host-death family protein
MERISLAEAKARLSELVDRAASGETIHISRRGKPAARLMPPEPERRKVDIDLLRAIRRLSPKQRDSAGEFMRKMRDDERY